ncbi:MAG: DUF4175 family protein [Myxococcota bacterium]
MADDIQQIRAFLTRLQGRERVLLLGKGILVGLLGLLVGALLIAVLLSAGVSRHASIIFAVLSVLGAIGGLIWSMWGWRAAGETHRQARLVEGLVPELRSRLLTAIDWETKDRGNVSEALLARAVMRARVLALKVTPAEVHSTRPLKQAGARFGGGVIVVLLAGWLLPIGPWEAIEVLLRGRAAVAAQTLDEASLNESGEFALVGDIVLSYTFPEYTGMDTLEVPNSDGTIHAPPGTRVRITARTAEAYEAAAIQINDGEPREVRLAGGRDIEATIEVEGEGSYRFILVRGQQLDQSQTFRIVVDADAPPVVSMESDSQVAAPVNQPLRLQWKAQDDFGLERVVLEIEQDGEVREFELRRPLDGDPELSGSVFMTPQELGLKSGSKARMRIVAYDNDWMAGGKRGESVEVEVDVLGPQAQGRRLAGYIRELRDALVLVLADYLVEDLPPASTQQGMLRWAESARKRYDPVRDLMKRQWGDETPSSTDGKQVSEVLESGARLIRFTVTTYDPSSGRRVTARDAETFAALHGEQLQQLEQAVYLLDMMLQRVGLQQLAEKAAELAEEARELTQFAKENPDAAALLARLDQLQRLMSRLAEAASRLDNGQTQEFVNSRTNEASNLMDEIRKAISEGRLEDAQKMLDQLAENLKQLSEGLGEQMSQQQQGDNQMSEQFDQLMEELDQLAQEQEQLANQLAEARQQEDDQAQRQAEAWEDVLELAILARDKSTEATEAVGDGSGWRVQSVGRMSRFQAAAADVVDAVRARDVEATVERVEQALRQSQIAAAAIDNELKRARPRQEAVPDGVRVALERTGEAVEALEKILELIEQQLENQQQESQQMQELAQQLAEQQQQLNQQQQKLEQQVRGLEQQMPTADGSASEAMQQAGDAMQRAEQRLQQGESMPGEGHQRDASGRLRSARDALQQQMAQYGQMQQRMQQMQGQRSGQGQQQQPQDDKGQGPSARSFEIPAPEEFQTPEEYRRALLEGMEADVPDEYKALKKRYYEELVRQ